MLGTPSKSLRSLSFLHSSIITVEMNQTHVISTNGATRMASECHKCEIKKDRENTLRIGAGRSLIQQLLRQV